MMSMVLRGVATMAALWGGERVLSRVVGGSPQATPPADSSLPPPPRFTEEQVAHVTRDVGGVRVFDAEVVRGLRQTLSLRSATRVRVREIPQGAWVVCPLCEEVETATDIVDRLTSRGYTVLGSLSLMLVRIASPEVALLVATRSELAVRELCGAAGHFAVLSAPARAPEVASPEAAPARAAGGAPPGPAPDGPEQTPARVEVVDAGGNLVGVDSSVIPIASRGPRKASTRPNGTSLRVKEDEGDAERDPARA